jgi:hypothetical protein
MLLMFSIGTAAYLLGTLVGSYTQVFKPDPAIRIGRSPILEPKLKGLQVSNNDNYLAYVVNSTRYGYIPEDIKELSEKQVAKLAKKLTKWGLKEEQKLQRLEVYKERYNRRSTDGKIKVYSTGIS